MRSIMEFAHVVLKPDETAAEANRTTIGATLEKL
jgi:hypothetical protein